MKSSRFYSSSLVGDASSKFSRLHTTHPESKCRFYSTNPSPEIEPTEVVPVVTYSNPDTQKLDILNDNKNKAGVYRWINNINKNTYVGSSVKLSLRFRSYFSVNFLEMEVKKK